MATFDPVDTLARSDDINSAAEQINYAGDRALGHGAFGDQVMHRTAIQFSDIVADGIKKAAGYNENRLRSLVVAVGYGAGVTHTWANNVADFRAKRQLLIDEWNHALASSFGVGPVNVGLVVAEAASKHEDSTKALEAADRQHGADVANARDAKARELDDRFRPIYDQFTRNAADRAGELRRDPTDADLRRLAATGVLAWGAYLAAPASANIPPPVTEAEGIKAGRILERLASGEQVDPKDVAWALAVLSQVDHYIAANGAASAQQFAFLGALYGTLGTGIYTIAGRIKDFPGLTTTQKFQYARDLADGLLDLGNEKVGGSYERLPEPLRKLLWDDPTATLSPGDEAPNVHLVLVNEAGWHGLSDLLAYASPEVAGGREFSTRLTFQIAKVVDAYGSVDGTSVLGKGLFFNRDELSGNLEHLIAVSTRNEQSDYDIIAGANGPDIFKKLVGFEWHDDGKAASGLTRWIARDIDHAHQAGSEDPRANDAAARLIEFVTSGSFKENSDSAAFFRGVRLNQEFGNSLSAIASVNVASFAVPAADGDVTSVVNGHVQISGTDRRDFLTIVGANETALHEFGVTAGKYIGYLNHDPATSSYADGLRGRNLLDAYYGATQELIHQQHVAEAGDAAAYQQKANQAVNAGKALAGTITGYIPGIGPLLGGVVDEIGDTLKDNISSASPASPSEASPYIPPADGGSHEASLAEQLYNDGGAADAHIPADLLSGEKDNFGNPQLRHNLSAADRGRLLDALYESSEKWRSYKLAYSH